MVAKRTTIKNFKRVSRWTFIMLEIVMLIREERYVYGRYLTILRLMTWKMSVGGQEREMGR